HAGNDAMDADLQLLVWARQDWVAARVVVAVWDVLPVTAHGLHFCLDVGNGALGGGLARANLPPGGGQERSNVCLLLDERSELIAHSIRRRRFVESLDHFVSSSRRGISIDPGAPASGLDRKVVDQAALVPKNLSVARVQMLAKVAVVVQPPPCRVGKDQITTA